MHLAGADLARHVVSCPGADTCNLAATRVAGRYAAEREIGEPFTAWLDRSGGTADVGQALDDIDQFEPPDVNPDLYIDYGETGAFEVEVGIFECAT